MTDSQKEKNIPEFAPPEQKCIERVHNQSESNSESEIKSLKKVTKLNFKDIISDYLYEINFPKDSKLQEVKFLALPNIYSITLPGSLTTIESNSFYKCEFLSEIKFLKNENEENNLSYIGDHAFSKTIIQSITIPGKIKQIGSFCFPSTLKQINFEDGAPYLEKVKCNAFKNTQIEFINMPSNIIPFVQSKNIFYGCKKLKKIIFDYFVNKNESIQINNEDENDEINELAISTMFSQFKLEQLELFVSNINYFLFYNTPNLNKITIPKSDNAKFIKQDGCLYTKNKKKLIVAERNVKNVKICSECQIITNYAFNIKCLEKVLFEKNSELKTISYLVFYESKIKDIVIPDTVKLIDYGSFLNCKNLESLKIPNSMSCIESVTFSYTNLREITIPKNITVIGYGVFFNCTQLQSVKFENDSNLSEIEDNVFVNTKIKTISIPKSVKKIGNYCFANCHDLKSIEFDVSQSNLIELGIGCFQNTQIEQFQLPQKIEKFDFSFTNAVDVCFANSCSLSFITNLNSSKIKQISIPSSVKEICSHAFHDCLNLTEVKIVDLQNSKLEKISDYAFYDCKNLSAFELPEKVNIFGLCSFKNCTKYNIRIKLNNANKITVYKYAFENSGIASFESKSESIKINDFAFKECKNFTAFSAISNKKCILGLSSFADCSSLKIVKLSANADVVEIGKNCFINSSIQKFEVPIHTKKIPKACFKNCSKLTELIINENCEIIKFGDESFSNSGLEAVFIPSQTQKIKELCFSECKSLKKLSFSNNLQDCHIYEKAFYKSGIEQLNIPNGITEIKSSCFKKCEKLKQVNFSENNQLKQIMPNTFKSSGIENLTTCSSISLIGKSAFQDCQQLTKVNILGDEVLISPFAFANCNNLQEIKYAFLITIQLIIYNQFPKFDIFKIDFIDEEIEKELIEPFFVSKQPLFEPFTKFKLSNAYTINEKWNSNKFLLNKITSFVDSNTDERYIFEKQNNIYYTNRKKDLVFCELFEESVMIAKETENICLSAFRYTNLKKIDFEKNSNLKIIDNFVFDNLQIEEISFPDSLTIIGNWAFNNCRLLKKVNINKECKLKTIGRYAFCKTAIQSFLFPATLTKVGHFAFYKCNMLNSIDNYSNDIKFKEGCFSLSSIENFTFPQNSVFGKSSFKYCYKIKKLNFLKEPNKIIFKEFSFAFSGLEMINFKCDVIIDDSAFIYCKSLKKVNLSGLNSKFRINSFANANIETLIMKNQVSSFNPIINLSIYNQLLNDPTSYQYFRNILLTNIEKISLNIAISNNINNEIVIHDFYLNHKCYVVNNTLVYADMINNNILFEKESEDNDKEEIKENEILHVPSNVKKIDFPVIMSHIKKINWGTNCIVEDLGPPGFFSYYSLTQINIPKLVKVIPPHLFDHCHFLETVTFENGSELESIGDFSFAHTRITKIVFPKTMQSIGKSAFYDNKYLREVVFNGQIIGDEAFASTGITSFNLSNNVICIGAYAFQYCNSLNKFDIDIEKSNLSKIGQYAFSESSINKIKIPPKVKTIKNSVFNGCNYFKEVFFSNESKLGTVRNHSFSGCLSLERINLPKTVSKLSFKAFTNTPSLQSIFDESNQFFNVMENKSVYTKDGNLVFVPRKLQQFEIKKNCSTIFGGSFSGSNLNKVVFPINSLINIEQFCFAHCTCLKEITIPNSVRYIGAESFIECQNLEKVKFQSQSKVKEIPKYCFAFSGLKSIEIPESIEIINHSSFLLCQNLKSIDLYNTKIKYIGDYAFSGTKIQEVKFPSSLQFLGNNAFGGIETLTNIDFSELEQIEDMRCKTKIQIKDLINNKKLFISSKKKSTKSNSHFIRPIKTFNEDDGEQDGKENEQTNDIEKITPSLSHSIISPTKPIIFKPTPNNRLSSPTRISPSYSAKVKLPPLSSKQTLRSQLALKVLRNIKYNDDFSEKNQDKNIEEQEEEILKSKLKTSSDDQDVLYQRENENYDDEEEEESIEKVDSNQDLNLSCFVHKSAFDNSFVKVFKFNIVEYKWFAFFDYCNEIEKIIANDDIQLILQKSLTKNIKESLSGYGYKIRELIWRNQENIPSLSGQLLNQFSISKTIKLLNPYQFSNCINLTHIEFEKDINIQEIPNNCFASTPLKKIIIPASVCSIKKSAFYSCTELEEVIFECDSQLNEIEENAFSQCEKLVNIEIPKNLKIISRYCFAFTGLKDIKIPNSVEKIDTMAFYSCKNLSHVVINNGIQEISELSFAYNNSLQSINLPDSLTTIKKKAFFNCSNLKKVKTTEKTQLIEIHDDAFRFTQIEELSVNRMATKLFDAVNVPNLNKITFYGEPVNFIQCEDGTIYDKNKKFKIKKSKYDIFELEDKMKTNLLKNVIFTNRYYCKSYHLYKNLRIYVFSVDEYMTKSFNIVYKRNRSRFTPLLHLLFVPTNLKSLKIHEDCFSISNSVIERIKNFETLEYANGITNFIFKMDNYDRKNGKINTIKILGDYSYIKESVFSHFNSLEVVEFGPKTNILLIPKNAFLGCIKLKEIVIPSSCISIEEGAFKNCISLSSVKFGATNSSEKIEYIRKEAFYNCSSLETIEIPSSVIAICEGSFMNCTKLQRINIAFDDEKGLEIIGKNAFKNCTSLKSFILPKTCIILGPSSFMNCTNLNKFEYEGKYLFSIQSRAFFNCTSLKSLKMVNLEYLNPYKNNENDDYKEFKNNNNFKSAFSIESEAFMNCTSLKEIIIEDQSKNLDTLILNEEGNCRCLFSLSQSIQKGAFCNCKNLSHAAFFLGNLEYFHRDAFKNCLSLKIIDINSTFSRYLLSESLYLNPFVATPDNLVIKLFCRNKCITTINVLSIQPKEYKKRLFNCFLSSLNKSLIIDIFYKIENNEIQTKKLKTTCIELFDSPAISFHFRCHSVFDKSDYCIVDTYHGLIYIRRIKDFIL